MNLQLHNSGKISGEVPNQGGTMLAGQSQRIGDLAPNQMQNSGLHFSALGMEPELGKLRRFMQQKIYEILTRRRHPSQEMPNKKMIEIVRRLEHGLFECATSKEEYLDQTTLERRLQILIKHRSLGNHNQQFSHASSSVSVGAMIPTPGFQQIENTNSMGTYIENSTGSSANALTSLTADYGGFLPNSTHVTMPGVHQQSSPSLSANIRGSNAMPSVGMSRMTYQMIPTPGIKNSSNDQDDNANNEANQNMDSTSNANGRPISESSNSLQPLMQIQHASNPNNMTAQNYGGLLGGVRSLSQPKSIAGPLNGGLGMMRNGMRMVNGMGTTETHLAGAAYENSSRPSHQHFEQLQQPETRGEVHGIAAVDSSGDGSLYTTITSSGSALNIQSSNTMPMRSLVTSSTPLDANHPSLYSSLHGTAMKVHSNDKIQENRFRSHYSAEGNPAQSLQNHQSQHQSQYMHGQLAHQVQLKNQLQNQMLQRNAFSQQQSFSSRVSEIKPDFEMDNSEVFLQSQVSEPFQFSGVPSQHFSSPPDTLDTCSTTQAKSSEHMQQLLQPQHNAVNPRSNYSGIADCNQPEFATDNRQSNVSHNVIASGALMSEKNVQEGGQRRLTGQYTGQQNNMPSAESSNCQSDTCRSADILRSSDAVCQSKSLVSEEQQFRNQQKWLLFLRHARRCPAPEGKCREKNCITVQKLLKHVENCNALKCDFPRCSATRLLVNHNRQCRDTSCPVCVPVKNFLQARARFDTNNGLRRPSSESLNSSLATQDLGRPVSEIPMKDTEENPEPPNKRPRTDQGGSPLVSETKNSPALPANESALKNEQNAGLHYESPGSLNSKITKPKVEIPDVVGQLGPKNFKLKDNSDTTGCNLPRSDPASLNISSVIGDQKLIKTEKNIGQAKSESSQIPPETAPKGGKTKVKGVSMIELFTPEQVRQHIRGLRQWIGQSKAKAERNQAMGHSMNENSCQLCALEKLTFEPPPIYCASCGIRIKRNAMYYAAGTGETRHCFCIPCYNMSRGDTIVLDGVTIPKARMEKKKNDEETEEWWVQCDKCEAWQHQICALFNGRRNDGGQAEYTCPNCYMLEVERGERTQLPHSAILGAKDLPRTSLSDHLEQRLYAKLKQERYDRARLQGKNYDEVPGADQLVVRVVSSADKKLDVKPRFLEIFREENYPTDYPYKSRVVLLFQRIEGVEVFLFGMYVQEFGSECLQPNQRRVYLSYLDSVKYFRPEVRAATGEALRTYVYHEILIGYLEYCKKRGFTSCYIWACPPSKGEDYIIYCHPEIQKTPKSDKLREWYLAMLRKAMKEKIVVGLTNLYEHFFVSSGECKARVTATRLPYFDGDYWPGAAEDFIHQLQQEEDGKKPQKGSIKKTISKRALKASGQTDLSGNASKDLLLMHKLGETISPMKEDFIMVHLQHACSHCCNLMVSGNRWICKQCKNFQLCDKCHGAELKLGDRERHPVNLKDAHALYPDEIVGIPDDTRDTEFIDSEIFDTRQAFLTLCQGNHYQYDTLRRAKHSSMMVLYHLHNPSAPAFVTQCVICHLDIEAGHGWHCETCPDYDVCSSCYQKDCARNHPHKLINHQSHDQLACNKEARQSRVLQQLRKMLDLLVHASQCPVLNCQYPNCRKVKGLFRHGMACSVRASGGCQLCKKMWYLLQLHSRACRESVCNVPRCRDMREHVRRLQQQSDTRRRAAVKEMMRQRAAEAAGTSC